MHKLVANIMQHHPTVAYLDSHGLHAVQQRLEHGAKAAGSQAPQRAVGALHDLDVWNGQEGRDLGYVRWGGVGRVRQHRVGGGVVRQKVGWLKCL